MDGWMDSFRGLCWACVSPSIPTSLLRSWADLSIGIWVVQHGTTWPVFCEVSKALLSLASWGQRHILDKSHFVVLLQIPSSFDYVNEFNIYVEPWKNGGRTVNSTIQLSSLQPTLKLVWLIYMSSTHSKESGFWITVLLSYSQPLSCTEVILGKR